MVCVKNSAFEMVGVLIKFMAMSYITTSRPIPVQLGILCYICILNETEP